jgi:hypothetical protein
MSSRADVNRGMGRVARQFDIVMRTLFVAVAILTITGVFPAMASLGSCAVKPCCAHEKAAAAITAHPACCNETTCSTAEAKPVELALQINARAGMLDGPVVSTSSIIAPAPITAHGPRHQRLGSPPAKHHPPTLSILLI